MAAIKTRRERKPLEAPPKVKATGAALSHTKLPPSFQAPSTRPTGPPPITGSNPSAVPGEKELLSEAQQQLQNLLAKQLDTSQTSLRSALSGSREFTPAVVYQPLANEMSGLRTLSQYVAKEEEIGKVDRLRQLGLSEREIELKLQEDGGNDLLLQSAKKRKLGAEPTAQRDRLTAVNQKISEREQMIEEPTRYHGVKQMSRHAMEVERSLFMGCGMGESLGHLTREERGINKMAYPKSIMTAVSSEDLGDTPQVDDSVTPTQLPAQVIERNRLSETEIRALPRFIHYSPGEPSKVLYLKNLDSRVSADDLRAVFGGDNSFGPCIRLMTGRMRGQAFVTFQSVEASTKALHLVNGYKVRGKPIIISFGRSS